MPKPTFSQWLTIRYGGEEADRILGDTRLTSYHRQAYNIAMGLNTTPQNRQEIKECIKNVS